MIGAPSLPAGCLSVPTSVVNASAPRPAAHRAARPPGATNGVVPLAALSQVPGIGPSRARALLRRFGSLQAMLAAGEEQLAVVPGIGPTLATAIRRRLQGLK